MIKAAFSFRFIHFTGFGSNLNFHTEVFNRRLCKTRIFGQAQGQRDFKIPITQRLGKKMVLQSIL
jgi:hypothetical protein